MKKLNFPKLIEEDDWVGYDIKAIKRFLTPLGYQKFRTWFSGQTGGISKDGKFCVYKDDFNRFLLTIGLSVG
jgi:hypothetical protein